MVLGRLLFAGLLALAGAAAPAQTSQGDDPYVWMEEIQGERALAWARAENSRTLGELQADRRYRQFYDNALAIAQARDRIPSVTFRADGLYNFWQDADHVRGIVRRTSLASYRTDNPQWETVLDVDALARTEGRSWVYQGMQCLPPEDRFCLVSLSDGGRDANVVREYDLRERRFVAGGFNLPDAKQSATWLDADTLLVAREWGAGTLTQSGYPFIVRRLRRGQTLDQAEEVFRGTPQQVGVFPGVLRDSDGWAHATFVVNFLTAFESEKTLLTARGPVRLPLPNRSALAGLVDGRVLVTLSEPWETHGQRFAADSIISYDLAEWTRDPLTARPALVWAPGPRQTLNNIRTTHGRLIVNILDNVRGRAFALDFAGGQWRRTDLALPQNATIAVMAASDQTDDAMFTVTDYLTPQTLWLYSGASGRLERIKSTPARFDASRHVVEQLEAVSRDGTRIPYFLVRPREMRMDGSTPTLLYGYGGFQQSMVPNYSGSMGRLWLEQGNAYVVANLRGGGEFGPEWHQSAQLANKQRTWDDYIAVAEDLIRRRITSPRRLGVVGGSQGGLLVGTAITQRPELFNAAIIQVPLFDMLRYHVIGAGASWIGEYGDPRIPEQRAWLEGYSPYQRLTPGRTYPMPFILTSTADDRVHPAHGRKAAARLREIGAPYYYYENIEGGHAAAANLQETARRLALEYTYASRRLVD
jgi:prolyl oligopeptidase